MKGIDEMKWLQRLFDSRKAFRDAGVDKLLIEVSEEQMERLKKEVLEIYQDILMYCNQNNITPFLVGGSALGAIRHNGFIPWDDDLDIGMIRSHYDKFVKEFEENFSSKYIVNSAGRDNNAKARFTKIMKKNTICRGLFAPQDDTINGIFVDLFPIDNVPNNRIKRAIKGFHCDFIEFISAQVYYKEFTKTTDEIQILKNMGKLNYFVRKALGFLFSYRSSSEWNARLDKVERWRDNNSKLCSIVPGRKHYFGEIINRDIIFPVRYVDFCGIKAPVFNKVEIYLENLYGKNYMKLPPVEKRERHMVKELKFGDE